MDKNKQNGITRRDALKLGAAAGAAALVGPLAPRVLRAEDLDDKLPQVPRRVLGKTGQSIPILVMGGAMALDKRFDPKLGECMRFGVNYIDAADCYSGGNCELAVGSFLEKIEGRDKVWITSKSDAHDPEGFEKTLNTSLEKLGTDYVDMYYLHAFQDAKFLNDDLHTLVKRLKKEGKIKHFGFSCHDGNVAELLHKAAETEWVESVMFRYNFRQYGEKELNTAIDAAHKAGVGLIAMKTQGSEASFADAWQKFQKTGKWSKHQAVLKAVWADERITASVSHMDSMEKVKQNIAAALDLEDLGQAEREALDLYAEATRPYACDGCDHICGPKVNAPVEIGTTMRFLMYHDVYGEPEKARELFAQLPAEAKRLKGIDFRGANRACPHGVDVAALMERASEVLA